VSATTVANRGPPSSRLISPKNSPGGSGTCLSADTSARAVPSMMRKPSSPPSPARVSRVPAATSNTRAIRATPSGRPLAARIKHRNVLEPCILSPWLAPSPDETGSRGAPDARSGDDPEMTAPPCGRGPAGLGAGCADEKEAGRLVTQPPGSRPILQRFWGTVSKDGEAQRRIRLGKSSRRDARGTGRPQALLAARSVENRDPASFSAAVIVRGSRRT
jgi:hypothetical protein